MSRVLLHRYVLLRHPQLVRLDRAEMPGAHPPARLLRLPDDVRLSSDAVTSIAEQITSLPPKRQQAMLAKLSTEKAASLRYDWNFWARENQIAPDGDWQTWLCMAGRGWGKTRTGAEFVRSNLDRVERWALVAPTASDGRDVMVRGESGLLAVFPPDERPLYEPSKRLVSFRNGSIGLIYSAEEPERLRGPQFGGAWCDEAGAWKYRDETWDLLQPALRLGEKPRQIVTTTPRPVKMIRDLLADPDCVVSHGTTFENVQNLAPSFAAHMRKRYEGTTMGRQELYAELLDEYPGAFWTREVLERNRVKSVELEEMQRIVVAVDPAATAGEEADQTGIVVAGKSHDGLYYVLSAEGVRMSPHGWASKVLDAYDRFQSDRIVAEVNNGGDMVVSTLQNERRDIPVRTIHASRGKSVRAEPIAALYEQDKVKHLGSLDALEDQQVAFPVASDLDDLVDAAVYALTELSGGQDFDTSAFPDPNELGQSNAWANA